MKVEIISESFIKPSSPTPPHLKHYKISLLDQFAPPLHIPIILFYPQQDNNNPTLKNSMLLKDSLSETLTHYYPLAGRIKDTFSVDCNDEGLCYIEAKSNICLFEYLTHPDLPSMNSLMPGYWFEPDPSLSYVSMIKETIFSCGSIAIGVLVSHLIMDAIALASFLKCWASIASKSSSESVISPNFDGPSIFPQNQSVKKDIRDPIFEPFLKNGNFSTRRFVFDAISLANLKIDSIVENPTRVEVVSALFLECLNTILKERSLSGIDKPIAFTHVVNLRSRATPPIPESSLGNLSWLTHGYCLPEEIKLSSLVCKVKEAIKKIDSEFVKKMCSNGGFNKLYEMMEEIGRDHRCSKKGVNFVQMSSWCNFGFYEIDFGWGKPIWVTCVALSLASYASPVLNTILLLDGANKGIEAWVYMDEEDLKLLEKHKSLLQYASLNPSPFNHGN